MARRHRLPMQKEMWVTYSAAIVTFRRPDSLALVLHGLAEQRSRPLVVSVADNDPEESARFVVERARGATGLEIVYVPIGENLGPAGGWARAVQSLQARTDRGDWVGVFDDDDPIEDPEVMDRLLTVARRSGTEVAAVGMRGALLHRPWARLHRVPSSETPADVDYLAGNGAPLYRWAVIDELGFFDDELFFGFEDLELGLRLRAASRRLIVVAAGQHEVADTATTRSAWREYYKTRALVTIARRHLGWAELTVTLLRSAVAGAVVIAVRHRQFGLAVARWRGALDGLRGRLGPQSYVPGANPPKPR
jgi:GT2 family glycosyltransferase